MTKVSRKAANEAKAFRASALSILYVGTLPPHNGGSAIVGYQLLIGLARAGHTVRAIAPITPSELSAGDKFANGHPEISVTRFLLPFFNSSPDQPVSEDYRILEDSATCSTFAATVSTARPDVLIIGRETFGWRLPDLAIAQKIPSLLIVQGSGLFGMKENFHPLQRRQLVEQLTKVDLLIAVAKHLIEGPMRELGLPKAQFIQNPVDRSKFYPTRKDRDLLATLGLREDNFIVAHASNLKPIKRTSDIVRSALEVIRSVPKAVYLIVGDGICLEEMKAQCRSSGVLDHFRFVGWVDHEAVPRYLNLADVVLMPSESEAAALVYLETQACAKVLIASDIAGAREIVRDGETGLLFRMGEVDDLTGRILLAAGDPELRDRIGHAGHEWVKARDIQRFVADYERVLLELVERYQRATRSAR